MSRRQNRPHIRCDVCRRMIPVRRPHHEVRGVGTVCSRCLAARDLYDRLGNTPTTDEAAS